MVKIYQFREHAFTVSGEKKDLIDLAEYLREADGTHGDLRYQIEYAFDIDDVRSSDTESESHNDVNYAEQYLIRS